MNNEISLKQAQVESGKYLVSPLCKQLEDGRFAASVSIRSGRGSGMHDRVFRLTPIFASSGAAVRYATAHGMQWVRERLPQPTPASLLCSAHCA